MGSGGSVIRHPSPERSDSTVGEVEEVGEKNDYIILGRCYRKKGRSLRNVNCKTDGSVGERVIWGRSTSSVSGNDSTTRPGSTEGRMGTSVRGSEL